MLKIGEFSKLSRVSVRMLRHYDEVGLLAPSEVDSMTGYPTTASGSSSPPDASPRCARSASA